MREGRWLDLEGMPATEAAAEAVGRMWLAEREEGQDAPPVVVSYADVAGERTFVEVGP